jgi:hypothetical protein
MTDNLLVREEGTGPAAKPVAVYDASAKNRFEFEIRHNGGVYDVAYIFDALEDSRYLQWIHEFNVKGNEDSVSEESREATCRLWDDVIGEVENIEYPEGADWKSLIDHQEKIDSLNQFLAVAIVEQEKQPGKLRLGTDSVPTEVMVTEAWMNGEIKQQTHTLKPKTIELEKKYSRIQGKRFKQQKVGGLRSKPKIEYVPQDEKIGELYDEMKIAAEGFKGDVIPLRFKTTVIHEIFASKLDPKK